MNNMFVLVMGLQCITPPQLHYLVRHFFQIKLAYPANTHPEQSIDFINK
jgi:hypothetical protein